MKYTDDYHKIANRGCFSPSYFAVTASSSIDTPEYLTGQCILVLQAEEELRPWHEN
jgi:hypothetical protein